MSETTDTDPPRRGLTQRLLDAVERVGNRLPDPVTLFVILAAMVVIASAIADARGWTEVHPKTGETIAAVNLMTVAGLRRMFTEAVSNFLGFKPLGVVLVAMLGIGVVERTGLLAAVLKMVVAAVPRGAMSAALVFAGVMSSLATDVGYVVLVPLGAALYAGLGRHPIAGLCAAFAGVSGGFSANLLIGPLDAMLSELTQLGAGTLDPTAAVPPTCNWYFMIASVPLITLIGWFITDRIVEPRLGKWQAPEDAALPSISAAITPRERRAALAALAAFLLVVAAAAALASPSVGVLYDTTPGLTAVKAMQPLFDAVIPLMLLAFLIPGLVYGVLIGAIRDDRTVAKMTADTINTMGVYIVLAFVAAQFIAYFNWSNLGAMIAIAGAESIKASGLGGATLVLAIVAATAVINLFIGSASAKWAIMAPVFVPMLMQIGIDPPMTQASYRVGDSITNIITPLMPYFPLVVAFGQKYDPKLRLGTLAAAMLPYSIALGLGWSMLLLLWWELGLPLGPGA